MAYRMTTRKELWNDWTSEYIYEGDPIPLFETTADDVVLTKEYGSDDRSILKRSPDMEDAIQREGMKVIGDWHTTDSEYEGLLYLMYRLQDGEVIPLYVGKAGKYGRDGERLSVNIADLRGRSKSKFARWGDGYAYHIGELSAAVLDHEKPPVQKYSDWADSLFEPDSRRLRTPVYFWTRAWKADDTGLYYDFETPLEEMEYQIVGIISDLYPDDLLNTEGA